MINKNEIQKFLADINYSYENLLDILPIGILIFDEKWEVKNVNENFISLLNLKIKSTDLLKKSLIANEYFDSSFPYLEISQLSNGKYFETIIKDKEFGFSKINIVLKGSPIFNNGKFEGGTLIAEDFRINKNNTKEDIPTFNSFTNFLQNICDCFLILDNEGVIKYTSILNDIGCNIFDKAEGKDISSIFNNLQSEQIASIIKLVATNNEPQNITLEYIPKNKKSIFNSVFIPLTDNNRKTDFIVVLLKNKRDKNKQVLEYLIESDELSEYQSIVSEYSEATFKLDSSGSIKFWTKDASNFFELSKENVYEQFIENLFPKINKAYFDKIINHLNSNKSWSKKLNYKKGQKFFEVNAKIAFTSDKKDLIVYCNHFSESQQRFEKAKLEEANFFKNTVLKSSEMILQIDPYGTISFVNEKFCKVFGYETDEISGVIFTELIDNKFKIENKISNLFEILNNKNFDIIPLISKTGTILNVCPEFNITHNGTDLEYYTVYLRICKKERKVISLIAESLLNDSKEAITILSDDKIVRANSQFIELFGYGEENQTIDISIYTFVNNADKQKLNDIILGNVIKNTFECETKLGKKIEIEIKKINKFSHDKYSILLFRPTDIQSLIPIEQNNYIENLVSSFNEFLWSAKIIENEINIEFINPGISKISGYNQLDFISKPLFWQKIIHPDDLQNVKEIITNLISTKDKYTDELNYRFIKKDGSTIWINNKIKVVRDKNGVPIKAYGSASDITDKVRENLKLQSEIIELKAKNETKDKFISIISHDLRSPFTSILGFTELIATDTTLTKEEVVEYVANIRDASQNTLNLVNSLLDWTRLQTGRIEISPKIVNANYLVKKTIVTLSGASYQKGIALTSQVDNSLFVNADENILTQVFNNLVSNSIKFTPKGGNITIDAKKLEDQQKVQFIVSDTGIGIKEEDIPKLFIVDKKFTTLGTDGEKGTGLGLSLVKEIIEKHNGEIYVESELGKGTKFIFTIPISSPSILLLDSNDAERNLYSKLMGSITKGIKIYSTNSIHNAKEIITNKTPMLIITEHKLSTSNGVDFIKEVIGLKLKYKPVFIVLSRNIEKASLEEYNVLGVEETFTKPVNLKDFKFALDNAIISN